jgi:hypothetical protein
MVTSLMEILMGLVQVAKTSFVKFYLCGQSGEIMEM